MTGSTPSPLPADIEALIQHWQYLEFECGYTNSRILSRTLMASVAPFIYTYAIITTKVGDRTSILDRWCFHTQPAAVEALNQWNPLTSRTPRGWHREPVTDIRPTPEQWADPNWWPADVFYRCPKCGFGSFNKNDKDNRYCSRCHAFEEHL